MCDSAATLKTPHAPPQVFLSYKAALECAEFINNSGTLVRGCIFYNLSLCLSLSLTEFHPFLDPDGSVLIESTDIS